MPVARSAVGEIEYLVTGSGEPTTVFVHGMAMSVPDTRPFGSGVVGTRVFPHLRGHGHSAAPPDPTGWSVAGFADDVRTVADATAATRGLGVSLGAAALLRLALDEPGRFDRLVLVLPAALDAPPPAPEQQAAADLADAIDAGDQVAVTRGLVAMQPPSARSRMDVKVWARRHADSLVRTPLSGALRAVGSLRPVADVAELATLNVPVLVLALRDDPRHPLAVAERLAAALPQASLEVLDVAPLWGGRAVTRELVTGFLNDRPAEWS